MDSTKSIWIKICGLTRVENALDVARLAPDAIGFVFFEKSPRNVSIDQARQIITHLPDTIEKIGVFVDAPFETVMHTVQKTGLTGVQLHGSEPPELISRLKKNGLTVIKALFAARTPFLEDCNKFDAADAILVEYGKGVLPGGNAESWNYEISKQLDTRLPIILAGGLSMANVGQAIVSAHPYGLDISSKVEAAPGVKDIQKTAAFIHAVRTAESS